MILFLSLQNELITIAFISKKFKFIKKANLKTENLLAFINETLLQKKFKLNIFSYIVVGELEGTFTGNRAIVATANSLSLVVNIPVFRIKERAVNLQNIKSWDKFTKNHNLIIVPEYSSGPAISAGI